MNNDKAIATSAAMVAVAAIASGALFFSAQTGASNIEPTPAAPQPAVVIEYVDAEGNLVPIEIDEPSQTAVAADTALAAPVSEYGDDEYEDHDEEENHDEYEDHEDHEEEGHDEYEDDD